MAEDNLSGGPTPEQVAEAKSLGWAPKEQWRGEADKFVDADVFLQRGLGIHHVRREAVEAKGKAEQLAADNARMAAELKALTATVGAIEESREADLEAARKEEKARLQTDYAEALKDGDHVRAAEIAGEMAENAALNKAPEKTATTTTTEERPALHPEVVAWNSENTDFMTDRRRVALANVVANEMRAAGDKRIGRAFLDDVRKEVETSMGTPARPGGQSKVEGDKGGGGNRGGGGGGGGKSYADLPAEAKAACDKQAARLVGPGRAHKDASSWRASYARQYFQNEAS